MSNILVWYDNFHESVVWITDLRRKQKYCTRLMKNSLMLILGNWKKNEMGDSLIKWYKSAEPRTKKTTRTNKMKWAFVSLIRRKRATISLLLVFWCVLSERQKIDKSRHRWINFIVFVLLPSWAVAAVNDFFPLFLFAENEFFLLQRTTAAAATKKRWKKIHHKRTYFN